MTSEDLNFFTIMISFSKRIKVNGYAKNTNGLSISLTRLSYFLLLYSMNIVLIHFLYFLLSSLIIRRNNLRMFSFAFNFRFLFTVFGMYTDDDYDE